jgi:hypothetical protein
MQSPEIVFIITCHEQPKSIVDMILNIRTLNQGNKIPLGFSLHFSYNFLVSDDDDEILLEQLVNNVLFPVDYNVTICPTRIPTQWAKIMVPLIVALKHAYDYFKSAKYFVFLASNSLQTYNNPINIVKKYKNNYFDYLATFFKVYPIDEKSNLVEHKFIKRIYEQNNKKLDHVAGIHEGIGMSRTITEKFLNLWYQVYNDIDEMIRENNNYGMSEEYIFHIYLHSLNNCTYGHNLCVRQQGYKEIVNSPTQEYLFVKPIHRDPNNVIRQMMREKYKYKDKYQTLIQINQSKKSLSCVYNNEMTRIYDGTKQNTIRDRLNIGGNASRTFHFEFKTNIKGGQCLIATGTANTNNCFNIKLMDNRAKTRLADFLVGIMCYNNVNRYYNIVKHIVL